MSCHDEGLFPIGGGPSLSVLKFRQGQLAGLLINFLLSLEVEVVGDVEVGATFVIEAEDECYQFSSGGQ